MAMHSSRPAPQPSLSEIMGMLGDSTPAPRHTAILATGASLAEIRVAVLRARGEDEALGEEPPRLEGRIALVYDILKADEPEEPDGPAAG